MSIALHPRREIGSVSLGGVVHSEIITDSPYNNRSGVEPDTHPEIYSILSLQLLAIGNKSLLDSQRSVARPLRMILVGYGGSEESHYPIAPELIDRALTLVDFIHENTEAAVHDLVDFFRIELLRHGGEPSHIREHHRHELALAFNGASVVRILSTRCFGV